MIYTTTVPPPGVDVIDSAQFDALLATPKPVTLMDEYLRVSAGQGVIVFGGPGELKTYLTLAAAVHLAVRGGRVLWLAGEGAKRAIVARIRNLLHGNGRAVADLEDRFVLVAGGFDVLDDDANVYLQQLTVQHEPTLVVLDPMAMFFAGDENAAGDVKPLLHELDQWRAIGIAVIVIHHARKPTEGRKADLRGSGAVRAWADVVVLVERPDMSRPSCRVTVQKARDEEPGAPTSVEFTFAEGSTSITRSQHVDNREAEVISLLRASVSPMTQTDLRKELKCNSKRISAAMSSLLAQGMIRLVEQTFVDRVGRARSTSSFEVVK